MLQLYYLLVIFITLHMKSFGVVKNKHFSSILRSKVLPCIAGVALFTSEVGAKTDMSLSDKFDIFATQVRTELGSLKADSIIQKDMIASLSKDIDGAKSAIAGIVVVTGTLASIAQIYQSTEAAKSSRKMEENISKLDNDPNKKFLLAASVTSVVLLCFIFIKLSS